MGNGARLGCNESQKSKRETVMDDCLEKVVVEMREYERRWFKSTYFIGDL